MQEQQQIHNDKSQWNKCSCVPIGNENQIKTPTSMHRIKIKKNQKNIKQNDLIVMRFSYRLSCYYYYYTFFLNSNANP